MTDTKTPEHQYTIFCDIDGVLANFRENVNKQIRTNFDPGFQFEADAYNSDESYRRKMWSYISEYQKKFGPVLWANLEPMPDAFQLWDYIKPYHPQILTATGQPKYHSQEQKRAWITQHLGSNVRVNTVQYAVDKQKFAGPNKILIDDTPRAVQPWIAAGGIGILHTSAANTITKLKELGL